MFGSRSKENYAISDLKRKSIPGSFSPIQNKSFILRLLQSHWRLTYLPHLTEDIVSRDLPFSEQ